MITREEREDFSLSTKQGNNNFIVSSRPISSSSATISSSSATISSSTSWSRSKDLRIFRVSKAFGGKDRHSKVCTIRGLRDRRVRLSVQTAIQVYDLQERLGLNQPSKVVDWLLNQAKHEIDQLPPLQIPPPGLNFPQNLHYSMLMDAHNASLSSNHQANMDINRDDDEQPKEIKEEKSRNEDMGNLNLGSHHHHHHQHGGYASELFQKPSNNTSLVQCLTNPNSLAYNNSSLVRWDPSNLSLSHPQQENNVDHQQFQNFNNNNSVPLQPSTSNNAPFGSQVVLYPPFGVPHPHQSYFDLQMLTSNNSHNHPLSSTNSLSQHHVESSSHHHEQGDAPPPLRPFHFSVMANFLSSNKDEDFDSR